MQVSQTRHTAASKTGAPSSQALSAAELHRMIAEKAYCRAEKRGFVGGDPVQDWLAAEAEINRQLTARSQRQIEELAAYDKLRREIKKRLTNVSGRVNADSVRHAIEQSTEALKDAGKYSAETVNKAIGIVRKDLAGAAQKMGPKWETFSDKTADLFTIWRDRGSTFLGEAATAVGAWLEQTGHKLERSTYVAGEMTYSGTLECTACGERVVLRKPAHLPSCPKCGKTEFRRI